MPHSSLAFLQSYFSILTCLHEVSTEYAMKLIVCLASCKQHGIVSVLEYSTLRSQTYVGDTTIYHKSSVLTSKYDHIFQLHTCPFCSLHYEASAIPSKNSARPHAPGSGILPIHSSSAPTYTARPSDAFIDLVSSAPFLLAAAASLRLPP